MEYRKDIVTRLSTNDALIYTAIPAGNIRLIERYISEGGNVDRQITVKGAMITPLLWACTWNVHSIVELLIKAKADVNLRSVTLDATPLYFASHNGYLEVVQLLIKAQANVNFQNKLGMTPLHAASEFGHREVVILLIKAKAALNVQTNAGESPLYTAARFGRHGVVNLLIKAQADVNLQTTDGKSPLYIASELGHGEVVDSLVRTRGKADVNLSDTKGFSPLHIASQKGHHSVANSLIRAQANVEQETIDGQSPLCIASRERHYKVVNLLIKAQVNVDFASTKSTALKPLSIAMKKNHLGIVGLLIKAGANVNLEIGGVSSLYFASRWNNIIVMKYLLKSQEDVDPREYNRESPLHTASNFGHQEVVNLLIEAGADVNLQENSQLTPLHLASQCGHHQVVDSLIKANADLDLQGDSGSSALHVASTKGHVQVVKNLIIAQADVNLRNNDGYVPLHGAVLYNHEQIVTALIKANADVNIQESNGFSPIYVATQTGHQQILKSLIQAQADVNLQEDRGHSPLIVASLEGHHQAVDSLITAQADVDIKTNEGESPIYFASQNGHDRIVKMLIRAKADVNAQRNTGSSPLFIASQEGYDRVVDCLIQAQANVNIQKCDGSTPLYVASQEGHDRVVSCLIQAQANVNIQTNKGSTPLLMASQEGHRKVVDMLIKAHADVNLLNNAGFAPLHCALMENHSQVVESLIQAGADVNIRTRKGALPLHFALQNRNQQIVQLLLNGKDGRRNYAMLSGCSVTQAPVTPKSSGTELSQKLHSALTQSGFVDSRAAMQSAISDVLEEIERKTTGQDDTYIVGSFSEGWGNSLTTLDGRVDIESDIDSMELLTGRLYHIRGLCKCDNVINAQEVEYNNGHIQCDGFSSNPARSQRTSQPRPAIDRVDACRLCCYPPIAPLQPDRVSKSNIPQSVLQSLNHELINSQCHVVHAASPGQAGKQLRVSTTFLEKRLLRSLSTLQGQLFVTLKYLVKKVICRKVQGIKAYHVKTITFRMLEETPVEQWQPENLLSLIRRSLQLLLYSVENSCNPVDNADGRIMDHFFLCDAGLYLKGADRCSIHEISGVLREIIEQLHELLIKFIESLSHVSESGIFHFHPFLILPELQTKHMITQESIARSLLHLELHPHNEIYGIIKTSLHHLWKKRDRNSQSQKFLTELIGMLPDCALSAREALRVLTCLKFKNEKAAVAVLSNCRGHKVSRGIAWCAEKSARDATVDFVWQHLRTCDSAWKFCFFLGQPRPIFKFLSRFMATCFPLELESAFLYSFMNFDALLQSLRFELRVDVISAQDWIRDVSQSVDADIQELLVCWFYCNDPKLWFFILKHIEFRTHEVPYALQETVRRDIKFHPEFP